MRAQQESFLSDLAGLTVRTSEARAQTFKAPPQGTLDDRWHVYTHGYLARIEETLSIDYRAVRRILGEGAFQSLIERYLHACPPRSFDLAHAGDRLASFLASDPSATALAFLPDLARLEWRMVEAFVAADESPLTRPALAALEPERATEVRFALQPSVSLIRSAWPLAEIWSLWDRPDDEVSLDVEGRGSSALVFRRGFAVVCEPIDEDAAAIVEAASGGATLSEISLLLGASNRVKVERMVASFTRLVDRGIFRNLEEDR